MQKNAKIKNKIYLHNNQIYTYKKEISNVNHYYYTMENKFLREEDSLTLHDIIQENNTKSTCLYHYKILS